MVDSDSLEMFIWQEVLNLSWACFISEQVCSSCGPEYTMLARPEVKRLEEGSTDTRMKVPSCLCQQAAHE